METESHNVELRAGGGPRSTPAAAARTGPPERRSGTQAIDRAAGLLVRVIEADEPLPFSRLHAESGLSKSTASRLLSALERHGLLGRDAAGAVMPGPVLTRYASRSGIAELIAAAQPVLERLGEKTGETVNLAVPAGAEVEQVAQVDSHYLLGATNGEGLRVPLHCSALGQVFVAFCGARLPRCLLGPRTSTSRTGRALTAAQTT